MAGVYTSQQSEALGIFLIFRRVEIHVLISIVRTIGCVINYWTVLITELNMQAFEPWRSKRIKENTQLREVFFSANVPCNNLYWIEFVLRATIRPATPIDYEYIWSNSLPYGRIIARGTHLIYIQLLSIYNEIINITTLYCIFIFLFPFGTSRI